MSDLYLECNSGISGDMAVAALLDAGADRGILQKALDSIPAHGFKTEIRRVNKSGIDCCDFNVILDREHENHDHDMQYLFGHEVSILQRGSVSTSSISEHEHLHEQEHHHHDEQKLHHNYEVSTGSIPRHEHHHEHRNLSDVLAIIDKTQMTDEARALAHKIFYIIAEAESKAHNLPLDKVHFHEVGALDSIVDVIAFAVCFESLHVNRVFVPFLNEGTGTVRCQHGILPIPVPAVANIVQTYELPLHIIQDNGEFITPTGAAFVAAIMTDKILPEMFTIKKIGMGAGKRNYLRPSILRAIIMEESLVNINAKSSQNITDKTGVAEAVDANTVDSEISDKIVKLETNIDDCTSESLGFVMDELLSNGAREVNYIPCFMKKNRPAYLLTVICTENDRNRIEEIIFKNTTTIGIRRSFMERTILSRTELELDSPYGKIRAKEVYAYGVHRILPEYDDVAEIAKKTGKSFPNVYSELADLCRNLKV